MKESFVFYRSYYEAILELPEDEQLKLFKAIVELGLNDNEIKLDGVLKVLFKLIKPNIKSSIARYKASVENGRKGGNPNFKKGQRNPYYPKKDNLEDNQRDNLNEDDNYNDNYNYNEDDNEDERELSNITLPTLTNIITYGSSLGASKEYCENFYNHYESIGWINGNGLPIKNWKLVLNNWYKKDLESGKIKQQVPSRRLD